VRPVRGSGRGSRPGPPACTSAPSTRSSAPDAGAARRLHASPATASKGSRQPGWRWRISPVSAHGLTSRCRSR
jgi:hypothetical protein